MLCFIIGKIIDLSIFSDCLNIEFIDILKRILKELKGLFTYDKKGISSIFDVLLSDQEIIEDEFFVKYVNEMKEVFIAQV